MATSDSQSQATSIIRAARLVAICSVIVFLLAVLDGAAPANYLLSGVVFGALLLVTLGLYWRTRRTGLQLVALLIVIVGHKLALQILPSESYPQFFQWLSLIWFTATILLCIFRARVFKICGLRAPSSTPP